MSSTEQFQSLQPPPEVVALGEPEKVVLLSKHWGSTDSWMNRFESDANFSAGWSLTAVGVVCLLLGVFAVAKKSPVEAVQVLWGLTVLSSIPGVYILRYRPFVVRPVAPAYAYAFYPEALAYYQEGAWKVVRWDEVEGFVGPSPGDSDVQLTLQDGSKLTMHNAGGFTARDAAGLVERRTFQPLLSRALAQLDRGDAVQFGPLGVSRHQLTYRGTALPWDNVEKIEVATPPNVGGLVGAMQALKVRLRISRRVPPPSLLWGKMGQPSPTFFEEQFLPLPNRAVLLALLDSGRPPHTKLKVDDAVNLYMPWNPALAGRA
jgi:hypothetical protein